MCVCVYVCVSTYVCECIYVCMCVCEYIFIFCKFSFLAKVFFSKP